MQGRIGTHGSLLGAERDVHQAMPSSMAAMALPSDLKESDPRGKEAGEEEGGPSDREEDALDDDAYYKKRNKVETIEDLRLQNETFPVKLYRMLYEVQKDGKGYAEDRRPNANVDPYIVAGLITEVVCSALEPKTGKKLKKPAAKKAAAKAK